MKKKNLISLLAGMSTLVGTVAQTNTSTNYPAPFTPREDLQQIVYGGTIISEIPELTEPYGANIKIKEITTDIDPFLRKISEYQAVHFGEMHPIKYHKTSTLQDFADTFLPKLRDPSIVKKPFDLLRTECLDFEKNEDGSNYIPQSELDEMDRTGVTPKGTPNIYKSTFGSDFGFVSKDPAGTLGLIRQGLASKISIRGIYPPKLLLAMMRDISKNSPEEVFMIMHSTAVAGKYLQAVRMDLTNGKKAMIYGGALHNDQNDIFDSGIGDEIRAEFPGKYIAIDIIKPSVVDQNDTYFQGISRAMAKRGKNINNLDRTQILELDNDPTAEYIVVLPSR